MTKAANATLEDQRKAANYVSTLKTETCKGGTFDSAAASEMLSGDTNRGAAMPEALAIVLDSMRKDQHATAIKLVLDSCAEYERRHGSAPTGDKLHNAFHAGSTLTIDRRAALNAPISALTFDDATSQHHDQISIRPNAPIIGTTMAIATAIPFAFYAPVDAASNEGRLVILSHQAEAAMGSYDRNETLDGINSGDTFVSSARVVKLVPGAAMNGQFRAGQTDHETPDPASPAVAILRGRCRVYVNGRPVAKEVDANGSAATSAVSGSATIGGTTYAIGGTVSPLTGAIALTSNPALPGTEEVHIEGFVDFENSQEGLSARFMTVSQTLPIFANPDRAIIRVSKDSETQFESEIGYSPLVEGSNAARVQYYNERFYRALFKAYRIGKKANFSTFDFAWATQGLQKTRSQIWGDFNAVLGAASQQMANDTLGSGIAFGFVSKSVAIQMAGLPAEIFTPSGLTPQAGIWRVGRLFGYVDIYYVPKVVAETADGAAGEMLFIGKNDQPARAPLVVGDAIAPAFTPLGIGDDQKKGYGFYARGFVETNPHAESHLACAVIAYTNLF